MAKSPDTIVYGYSKQPNSQLYKEYTEGCGNCKSFHCRTGDHVYGSKSCAAGLCPRKDKCTQANPNNCPLIGTNTGNARFIDAARVSSGVIDVRCTYQNGDFQTEEDISAYVSKFGSTNDLNNSILPYFCNQNENAASDTCKLYCTDRWSTHPPCAVALQNYCSIEDNAVNDDFCYGQCLNPPDGIRPSWCDTQITSVCKQMRVQSNTEINNATFYSTSSSAPSLHLLLMLIVVIVIVAIGFGGFVW